MGFLCSQIIKLYKTMCFQSSRPKIRSKTNVASSLAPHTTSLHIYIKPQPPTKILISNRHLLFLIQSDKGLEFQAKMCKGFQQNERDRLKIKAFYLHLSFSSPTKNALPDCLTLHYLPRISESPLEINDSKIRSDAPGFVTLHRVVSPETKGVIYGSRDRVKASEGVRFEIYIADVKILRGIFGKDGVEENWRIDCKSMLDNDDLHVKGAEVCVVVEGRAAGSAAEVITEKVEMTVKRRRSRRKSCFQKLEEIPEQREVENELEESTCCCSECEGEEDFDGGDTVEEEAETEGVGWALDVGLWVMCLGVGVGYLVSRASSKRLRRRRLI